MITNTCGQCALAQHNGGICPVFNRAPATDDTGCPMFTLELVNCSICGALINPNYAILELDDNNKVSFTCGNCQKQWGTCATCIHSSTCAFETDPSPIPKMIQQEFRQGNMRTIQTVANPSRIDITCKNGCPCFDPELGCLKQNNLCNNWSR